MSKKKSHNRGSEKKSKNSSKGENTKYLKSTVVVSTSPSEYAELITEAEKGAEEILLLPKRLTVMFKSDEMIEEMAIKRFGEGSHYIKKYIEEHMSRKSSFKNILENGGKIYEIHNKNEIETYLKIRNHVGIGIIEQHHISMMLEKWKNAMSKYSNQYFVGLTETTIPIKYELINCEKVIIHESTGTDTDQRMNALFITSKEVGKKIHKDFFTIWQGIDPSNRNKDQLINWINCISQENGL